MSDSGVKNLPASVHQRLLNKARERGRPFNELLQSMGSQAVEPDGLVFQPRSFEGVRIAEDSRYEGVRVRFRGNLGNAIILMQVDIGFGDVISPDPQEVDYPSILDLPKPRILGYTMDSVIAEKFEAMVTLGALNSRMKDFYDIWRLSRQFPFDGSVLSVAVERTFSRRRTEIRTTPIVFTPGFSRIPGKQAQWAAFRNTSRLEDAPANLSDVSAQLTNFLGPIADHLSARRAFHGSWEPPGPWSPSSRGKE